MLIERAGLTQFHAYSSVIVSVFLHVNRGTRFVTAPLDERSSLSPGDPSLGSFGNTVFYWSVTIYLIVLVQQKERVGEREIEQWL